jgi:beta-galactosidase
VEEFLPLRVGAAAGIDWRGDRLAVDVWAEDVATLGAEVRATYLDGPAAGGPAITRHRHGAGTGWYISTRPDADGLARIFDDIYADAGLVPAGLPAGLEVIRRQGDAADFVVAVNHAQTPATLPIDGVDLLTGRAAEGEITVDAGGVAVIRTSRSARSGR